MPEQLKQKPCFFLLIGWVAAAICLCAATAAAASQVDSTPQEVFDAMRGSFQPAKSKGVHVSYQWDLSWTERRPMVDRGKRWDLQNGNGKNRQSQRHFYRQRQGLGRHL